MELYDKKFFINGNCMIRSFGQPGQDRCKYSSVTKTTDKNPIGDAPIKLRLTP